MAEVRRRPGPVDPGPPTPPRGTPSRSRGICERSRAERTRPKRRLRTTRTPAQLPKPARLGSTQDSVLGSLSSPHLSSILHRSDTLAASMRPELRRHHRGSKSRASLESLFSGPAGTSSARDPTFTYELTVPKRAPRIQPTRSRGGADVFLRGPDRSGRPVGVSRRRFPGTLGQRSAAGSPDPCAYLLRPTT